MEPRQQSWPAKRKCCKKIFGDKNHHENQEEIQYTCIREVSPAASKFNADNNIQPLLDSSLFSISRNFTMAQLAVSVLWLLALLLISDTINLDTCCVNAKMSQNFSFISLDGLDPNT